MLDRLRERVVQLLRREKLPGDTAVARSDRAGEPDLVTLEGPGRQAAPGDIRRLRRERRRMLRAREQSVRDLGGLTLEMVRRDAFNADLLQRRARDILGLEESVYDLEDALENARHASPDSAIVPTTRCSCGAWSNSGATSCSSCGRALQPPGTSAICSHCAASLPAGARYCPSCGTASETTHESPTGAGW